MIIWLITSIIIVCCDYLLQVGCVDKLEKDIKAALGVLGGIAIAIALIQLIGVVFACCLGRSIRKEYEVV